MADATHYWWVVFVRAFWDSLALFVENPKLLLLGLLGAAVTALLVRLVRGPGAFMEHIKARIGIAFGGAVLTWALVFPYYLWVTPSKQLSEATMQITVLEEKERAAVIGRETAELQLNAINNTAIIPPCSAAPAPPRKPSLPRQPTQDEIDGKLAQDALQLAMKIRKLHQDWMAEESKLLDPSGDPTLRAANLNHLAGVTMNEFVDKYAGPARILREKLLSRLPSGSGSLMMDTLYEHLGASPNPLILTEVADELEHLARLLQDQISMQQTRVH